MSVILQIRHTTVYRYANPVDFTEHRVVFRPRSGGDLRMLELSLNVIPEAEVRWVQDVFSNAVALVQPTSPATELRFECGLTVQHYGDVAPEVPIAAHAQQYPFDYSEDEVVDLQSFRNVYYDDPEGRVAAFVDRFMPPVGQSADTRELLKSITSTIAAEFVYVQRDAPGTQSPHETMSLNAGTCRDFALLMMEVVRRMGFAARFVSGYIYVPALDPAQAGSDDAPLVGGGATHAWLHIYVPGAGWLPFDPTNSLYGGTDLIQVAYARDPSQALPVTGTFFGGTNDLIGMDVDVQVTRSIA